MLKLEISLAVDLSFDEGVLIEVTEVSYDKEDIDLSPEYVMDDQDPCLSQLDHGEQLVWVVRIASNDSSKGN